jgi:YD repeat-containing protein
VTDPNGHRINYTIDSSHRATRIAAGSDTHNLTWNADNQVTQDLTPIGTTTYTYDSRNNLTQVSDQLGTMSSAQYND